jgi:hypothetical protein
MIAGGYHPSPPLLFSGWIFGISGLREWRGGKILIPDILSGKYLE